MTNLKIEIRKKEDLNKIDSNYEEVVLKVKPSIKLITLILNLFPKLRTITLSRNLKRYAKPKVWSTLEKMNIKIKTYKNKKGRKLKYSIDEKTIKKIVDSKNVSIRKFAMKLGIPKSTLHRYIMKYKEGEYG